MAPGRRLCLVGLLLGLVAPACVAPEPAPWEVRVGETEAAPVAEPEAAAPTLQEEPKAPAAPVGDPSEACEGCEEVSLEDIVDGQPLVEGDILIDPGFTTEQGIAGSTASGLRLWPRGIIPYTIDPGVTARERITEAANHWRDLAGIRLVPRTNQADYVRFVNQPRCASHLGRRGGRQDIYLGNACSLGNTIHEIGHALGLYHEQSRSDRDKYVTIDLANVDPTKRSQYRSTAFTSIGEYDLTSIMHYSSYAFSANKKPVMTTKDGKLINGNRASLSPKDVAGVRQLYAGQNLPAPSPGFGAATAKWEAVLRQYPTALDKPLGEIPSSALVQRLGERSGNYLFVAHGGRRGWVYAPFLSP